jgi:hypothetical protein
MAGRLPVGPPVTPSTPAATGGAGLGAKIAGGLAVIGAIIGGGLWLSSRPLAPPPPPQAVDPAPAPVTANPVPAAVEEPAPVTTENAPRPPHTKPAPGPSEATLLQRAQAVLRSDPGRALALTQEHRRRYPQGELSQEREVIAIEALSRLGRSREAGKRAEDFGKSYPGSAHQKKVETSVEQSKR